MLLQGMRKEEQDNDVRLAATKALYNAIEFASTNFRNETERNYLMQVLMILQLLLRSSCVAPSAHGLRFAILMTIAALNPS